MAQADAEAVPVGVAVVARVVLQTSLAIAATVLLLLATARLALGTDLRGLTSARPTTGRRRLATALPRASLTAMARRLLAPLWLLLLLATVLPLTARRTTRTTTERLRTRLRTPPPSRATLLPPLLRTTARRTLRRPRLLPVLPVRVTRTPPSATRPARRALGARPSFRPEARFLPSTPLALRTRRWTRTRARLLMTCPRRVRTIRETSAALAHATSRTRLGTSGATAAAPPPGASPLASLCVSCPLRD